MMENYKKSDFFHLSYSKWIILLLIAAIVAVYWPVKQYGFIFFDDPDYVSQNVYVRDGITIDGIKGVFRFPEKGERTYWQPITFISHMLDCQIFGVNAGWHHVTNVIIHILNAILLFIVFKIMTGCMWRSAFVSALFALHPLGVDSVVWIAERKNLLSTFFLFLTILAYLKYVEKGGLVRYGIINICFVLGLLSKPMIVTLPFVLLLLDLWPLGRLKNFEFIEKKGGLLLLLKDFRNLVIEKIPLFLFSGLCVYWSKLSMRYLDIGISMVSRPMKYRVANALVSYIKYIGKALWPFNLTYFYPYPRVMLPAWKILSSVIILALVTIVVIWQIRKRPWLTVGWFWFLGTLVPVSGLSQNGLWPAMAERWSYVPNIGLFLMIAWQIPDFLSGTKYGKKALMLSSIILVFNYSLATRNQMRYWGNNRLFNQHAIDVAKGNWMAQNNVGGYLLKENRIDEAVSHLKISLKILPSYDMALFNMGCAMKQKGQLNKAIQYFNDAISVKPDYPDAFNNLGLVYLKLGKTDKAIQNLKTAISIDPNHAEALNNLGTIREKKGELNEAALLYSRAIENNPDYAQAHNNLGSLLARQNRINEAKRHFSEAVRIQPEYWEAHQNLGLTLDAMGDYQAAMTQFKKALGIKPDYADLFNNIAITLFHMKQYKESIIAFKKATNLAPDRADIRYNLKKVLSIYHAKKSG